MSAITEYEGERLSFYKLFAEKNYTITIPIIQREYAQGRKGNKIEDIRKDFLDALYSYLDEGTPNRDLDFVYGNIEKTEAEELFIPLDGQQRLTTLFLLHWYLYQISDNEKLKDDFISHMKKNGKCRFSYRTRVSSTEFCDELIKYKLDIDHLRNGNISETIKNENWFCYSWQYDPTIQSMLVMIESIHEKFKGRPEFFNGLLNLENPIITFLFMDLNKYQLTDELYIKMNSRGKPLTDFENFKAKFEQRIKDFDDKGEVYTLEFGKDEKKVSLSEYYSFKMDTEWMDYLWNYKELDSRGQVILDDFILNLYRVIFTCQYSIDHVLKSDEKDAVLELLKSDERISYNQYQEKGVLSKNAVSYLISVLDILTDLFKKKKCNISEGYAFYYNEADMLRKMLHNEVNTNADYIKIHAYFRYLIKNKSADGIEEWMRVVHNLTHPENTIIDTDARFTSCIEEIEHLLPNSNNILDFLANDGNIDHYNSIQVVEERIKAQLVLKDDKWKSVVENTEQHCYFNGQIGFILTFSGVFDYYDENKNLNWTPKENKGYYESFCQYSEKAKLVFADSYEHRINDENYCFERAVLTKGDYLTEMSSPYGCVKRKNLLSSKAVTQNNIKRDHSWKRVLRLPIENKEESIKRQNFVKQVFDDERFDVLDIKGSLEKICKDGADVPWKKVLITNPVIWEFCRHGVVNFDGKGPYGKHNIEIMGHSNYNQYHYELFTLNLWKKNEERMKSFTDVFDVQYREVKRNDDSGHLIMTGITNNRRSYEVTIYGHTENNFNGCSYTFYFSKAKGKHSIDEYSDELKDLLKECGFKWHGTDEEGNPVYGPDLYYYKDAENDSGVLTLIQKLHDKLLEIL